jgi:hypothetical protein
MAARCLVPLALVLAGCIAQRTPAWQEPALPDDTLVTRAHAALVADHVEQAVALAERALYQRNPRFRQEVQRRAPPAALFAAAEREDLPALVIYADALLQWSDRHGTPTLLAQQDRIREAALRAWRIDRRFAYGAPDRILATLFATLPVGSGKNYVLALDHFEAARAAGPGYLPTLLAYAQRYAAPLGDARLYGQLLDEILRADPAALPDAAAENRATQARARAIVSSKK